MSDFLAGIPVGDLSYPAVILGVVIAVIRGDIVPRKTLEAAVKERDYWRDFAFQLLATNKKAVDAAEVTAHVVASIPPLPVLDEDGASS